MAGHNKWSKIKRKKAANDVARANDHTKAARAIEAASRACQGDMTDIQLQSAISAARGVRLPKAIERGANPQAVKDGMEYAVRRYDGMVPAGDKNRNRTAANVRHLVTKRGEELLPTGANAWLFEQMGLVWVAKHMAAKDSADDDADQSAKGEVNEDALLECALEGGATDVEFNEEGGGAADEEDDETANNHALIKCEPGDMLQLVQALKAGGYVTTQFESQWLLKDDDNKVELSGEGAEMFEAFLSAMDDDLDVTNVFHNASFADDS